MADKPQSVSSKRKLRAAPETVRERAERTTSQDDKAKKQSGRRALPTSWLRSIGKPFAFVGRFIIPPYVRNSWHELRQVTWPNRKQTRQLTTAVILFSIVFGILVAVFDYGLDKLFKEVIVK